MKLSTLSSITGCLAVSPSAAFAHAGHGHAEGALAAVMHWLGAPDHLVVVVAVALGTLWFVRKSRSDTALTSSRPSDAEKEG